LEEEREKGVSEKRKRERKKELTLGK